MMPSNIFATTNTNVSILFVDKTRTDDDRIILIDASKLGKNKIRRRAKDYTFYTG